MAILRLHHSLMVFALILQSALIAETLHVGSGQPYTTLEDAIDDVSPGDTILLHAGVYSGGIFGGNVQGTPSAWIYIFALEGETVIFDGGANAWQFSDAAYLEINGFIFQEQTGNGVNFDDGGSYETPAHHVVFDNCTFRDMAASGNNDLLKLSGLDDFEIINCTFLNGAAGGSGIDMVGCHDGLIKNNHFENLGSNSIQAKGGTRNIRIEANFFINGGARAVNLGGSTGLQFFRPIDAPYEAAELKVYSNVFIGSEAPIAFVGSIDCEVVNNTIYLPTKWVIRILQETVDPDRFPPCGNNSFINNIMYLDNQVNVEVNIGPNTAPETFTFSNNLWYQSDDPNWPGPDLPVEDTDNIVGEDPLFANPGIHDFDLLEASPAIGQGLDVAVPELDFNADAFAEPRSIGGLEGETVLLAIEDENKKDGKKERKIKSHQFKIYPNPTIGEIHIAFPEYVSGDFEVSILTMDGKEITNFSGKYEKSVANLSLPGLMSGTYMLRIISDGRKENHMLVLMP